MKNANVGAQNLVPFSCLAKELGIREMEVMVLLNENNNVNAGFAHIQQINC